jgi:hypothetical protein
MPTSFYRHNAQRKPAPRPKIDHASTPRNRDPRTNRKHLQINTLRTMPRTSPGSPTVTYCTERGDPETSRLSTIESMSRVAGKGSDFAIFRLLTSILSLKKTKLVDSTSRGARRRGGGERCASWDGVLRKRLTRSGSFVRRRHRLVTPAGLGALAWSRWTR